MTLDIAQSMSLLIISILAIAILLRILFIVHRQTHHVKELEMRMKAIETRAVDTAGQINQATNEEKEV